MSPIPPVFLFRMNEDLYSTQLAAIFIQKFGESRWFGIGYTGVEMASDYQNISGADFTFDVALGVGYTVSDTLSIGAGLVTTNLNGDDQIFGGINFSWVPCEKWNFAVYGANALVRYNISDCWFLSLTGTPGGGNWNIDDNAGQSRTVELDSYWVGLSTHHRITEQVWISAGLGYTFANEIQFKQDYGNGPSSSRDLDGAALTQISLSVHEW